MTEILHRKLAVVRKQYGKCEADYERYSVLAVIGLYGVDILEDNAEICRRNLFEIWNEAYTENVKELFNPQCQAAVKYILQKNILCGDALTMLRDDGSPIIFAEWSFIENQVKRRDFRLDVLMKENIDEEMYEPQLSLFSDTDQYTENWMMDPVTNQSIPRPVREYPLSDYREVQNVG